MKSFEPVRTCDGSWQQLQSEWDKQCQEAAEDFATYASGAFAELEKLAGQPEPRAGVYALKRDGNYDALCQLNCTTLPGYDGPVLRTRFMTLAPRFDFGEFSIEQYGEVLVNFFGGVINLSEREGTMQARHIKFHLPSPSDRTFFASFGTHLGGTSAFEAVRVQGGWLYVTKNQ